MLFDDHWMPDITRDEVMDILDIDAIHNTNYSYRQGWADTP